MTMKLISVLMLNLVLFSCQAFEMSKELTITPLVDGVFLHKSYKEVSGFGLVGSNGLVATENKHAYIIDTPWTPEDTVKLVTWIEARGFIVKASISTHSHQDRAGGISVLNDLKIPTYTS